MHLSNSFSNETISLATSNSLSLATLNSLFDNYSLFDAAWPALIVVLGGVCAAAAVYAKSRLAKRLVPVKVRKH